MCSAADGRIIDTSQPTGNSPYIIVYTVTNSAGLTTTLRRTVEVADPCSAPLTYCNSTGAAFHYSKLSAWGGRYMLIHAVVTVLPGWLMLCHGCPLVC